MNKKYKYLLFATLLFFGFIFISPNLIKADPPSNFTVVCYNEEYSIINKEIFCNVTNNLVQASIYNVGINLTTENGAEHIRGVEIFESRNFTRNVPIRETVCTDGTYSNGTSYQNCSTSNNGFRQEILNEFRNLNVTENGNGRFSGDDSLFLGGQSKIYKYVWKTPLNTNGNWTINPTQEWNVDWNFWRQVNITEGEGFNRNNFPYNLTVTYDSDMNTDFSDLRFTNGTGANAQELLYWIENKLDSDVARVRVAVNLTASSITSIYMFYGNSVATTTSNVRDTFKIGGYLGDDFNGTTLDTTQWINDSAGGGISGGLYNYLSVATGQRITSVANFTPPVMMRIKMQDQGADPNYFAGFGFGFEGTRLGKDIFTGGRNYLVSYQGGVGSEGGDFGAVAGIFQLLWKASGGGAGNVTLYDDGVNATFVGDNTPDNPLIVNLGQIRNPGFGGTNVQGEFDWVYVLPFLTTEPTSVTGTEQITGNLFISLDSPEDYTGSVGATGLRLNRAIFNVTPTSKSGNALVNLTLYHNQSTWHRNYTTTLMVNNTVFSINMSENLSEGIYLWSAETCTAITCELNSSNYTTIVDLTIPATNTSSPTENQKFTSSTTFVQWYLNITVNEFNNHTYFWNLSWTDDSDLSTGVEYSNVYFDSSSGNTTNNTYFNMTAVTGGQKNYLATIWSNDSSGNENTTYINFILNEDVAGGGTPSGGGGGGQPGTQPDLNKSWTMTTTQGSGKYEVGVLQERERTLGINFQNTGEESNTIELFCENVEGELCGYVSFEEIKFSLPLSINIKTRVDFTIAPSELVQDGNYIFNVIGVDEVGKKGVVTVQVEVGGNIFDVIFTKLLFLSRFGIPYFIFYIFLLVPLISLLFYFGIFKRALKEKGGGGYSLIFGIIGGFLLLGFPFV